MRSNWAMKPAGFSENLKNIAGLDKISVFS